MYQGTCNQFSLEGDKTCHPKYFHLYVISSKIYTACIVCDLSIDHHDRTSEIWCVTLKVVSFVAWLF